MYNSNVNKTERGMNMYQDMIKKIVIGMSWINESFSNFRHEELQEAVLNVVNGEKTEGYALEKYFFNHSFDDEYSMIRGWTELMDIDIPWSESRLVFENDLDNVQMVTYGMNELVIGLNRLSALYRLQPNLRNILMEKEYEGEYNPFKLYGVVGFERMARGWRKAFLSELKTLLGRRKIESKKKRVEKKYYEVTGYEDEKGWKTVHDPITMKEEENRIQVLNEASAIEMNPQWYEKEMLSEITEKEYEEWYTTTYLEDIIKMTN